MKYAGSWTQIAAKMAKAEQDRVQLSLMSKCPFDMNGRILQRITLAPGERFQMRRFLLWFAASLIAVSWCWAEEPNGDKEARAIVEHAVQAAGWEKDGANLKMTWKDRGTLSFQGSKMTFEAKWTFAAPDKYHFMMEGMFGKMKLNITVAVNGDSAWESAFGQTRAITGEKLEYTKTEAYQFHVLSLSPILSDKSFVLRRLPDSKVGDADAVVVEVRSEGRPNMKIYFDKRTGLLSKSEIRVKDEFQNWKEVIDESYLSDWKNVGGRKAFTKLRIVRDGKTLIESEISDQKVLDKVDANLFDNPAK